jgi:hypothetical protein
MSLSVCVCLSFLGVCLSVCVCLSRHSVCVSVSLSVCVCLFYVCVYLALFLTGYSNVGMCVRGLSLSLFNTDAILSFEVFPFYAHSLFHLFLLFSHNMQPQVPTASTHGFPPFSLFHLSPFLTPHKVLLPSLTYDTPSLVLHPLIVLSQSLSAIAVLSHPFRSRASYTLRYNRHKESVSRSLVVH